MLVKYQDDIRRWFYTSQNINPLKWICANKILTRRDSRDCLWIKDKHMEELVTYEEVTTTEEASEASHDEVKHYEL